MEVSASAVKELREKTGAGMMDCKKALAETDGDVQKGYRLSAPEGAWPRQRRKQIAWRRTVPWALTFTQAARSACSWKSIVKPILSRARRSFRSLLKDIAMQVAAANPRYSRREEVPADGTRQRKDDLSPAGAGNRQAGKGRR